MTFHKYSLNLQLVNSKITNTFQLVIISDINT